MFRRKKKKTFLQRCEADLIKIQKKSRKKLRKFFKNASKKERRFRKILKNGARYMEMAVNVLFIGVVFFLFLKKAKDPEFLNDFGATKL